MAPGNDHPPTNRPTFQTRTAVDVAGELNSRFSVFVDDSTPSQETQFDGDEPSGSNEALSSGTSKGGSILSSPFNFTKRVLNIQNGSSSTETTPLLRKRTTTNGQKSQTSPTRAGPHADQRNPDGDDKRTKPGLGPRPVGGSDKLGTFSGVFVPTCLNVLSILMFLRFGFILGQAGVLGIMGMLVAAYSIDLITIFSLSAIASNGTVRGGGAYYLISRSLGPEFGGAIGLVFYMGQVFNTGLNAVALVDAIQNNIGAATGDWARILPESQGYNYLWATVVLLVCTGTCLAGSGVFARASNGLLIILLISTMSIPFSALVMAPFESRQLGIQFTGVSLDTFKGNLFPRFTKGAAGSQSKGRESFQGLFGILFPATSGIFAGASMSGDLKHPSKAIPKGTLWALALTFVSYTLVILSLACTVTRASFVADINIIQDTNVSAALVLAGEFATTFFSTLMGVIGCAKLMQALARDELYPGLSIFGQGTKKADEPVYAICFTYLAAQIVMLFDINQIASLITMAYLMTFLVMNLATFLLKIGSAPNFRPSFHFFSWQTAFLGAVFSGTAMIFVDGVYASVCVAILIVLFLLVHYTSRPRSWGDVSQSLIYHQVRKYLLRLKPEHVKFWRPQILLFVNDPRRQYKLIQFCNSMKKGSLYILGHVVVSDDFGRTVPEARRQQVAWSKYIEFSNVKAFVNIAISPTLEWGVRNLSLSAGLGGMRPNIAVIGFYNMDDLNKSKSTTLSSPTDAAGTQTPSDGYDQEAPKDGPSDDTSGLKLAAQLPTDSCQTESTTSIMSYVTVLEDLLLRLQINVAVARGFNGLEIPNPKGHNKKKYIDLWPIQMSAEIAADGPMMANLLTTNFDTYTLILQLGCILNTVPSWKKSYKLRVAVFVEYETDVEEERIRVKSLLENLRIHATCPALPIDDHLPCDDTSTSSCEPKSRARISACCILTSASVFPTISWPSRLVKMDAPEPDQTPFASVSAQTSKLQRQYQALLDQSTPYVTYRWVGTAVLLLLFFARILYAQGWYIVAYALGIYLLNLFLAFLQPKFDPSNEAIDNEMEDGAAGSLPTKQDEEFRPFIRRLPEFKFWHSATRVIFIGFICSWFEIFNVPVFWPVLVMYWFILFFLTMRKQIQHMIKYRYVPFSMGKTRYNRNAE